MAKTPECEMGRHKEICSSQDQCECECHGRYKLNNVNPNEKIQRRKDSLGEPRFSNA
jgi:hypothetical protein